MVASTTARLASSGGEVQEVLAAVFHEDLLTNIDPPKGFAHSLLSAIHKANFHLLLTSLSVVDMSDIEASIERPAVKIWNEELAAQVRSLAGEGATAWHLQTPYNHHYQLTPEQTRRAVRFELGLPQPGLEHHMQAGVHRMQSSSYEVFAKVTGHAVLNQKKNTSLGGAYYTHNAMVRALEHIVKDIDPVAIHATQRCTGLLGCRRRNENDNSDTVGDLLITGVNPYYNGLIVDVSFTHPISGKGKAKGHAHDQTGHAASVAELGKINNYTNVCREAHYEFSAFVFETYGLMAPQTISLLYRLAEIASADVDIRDIAYRDSRKANKGRKYTKWVKQLSLARIKTIADRLIGAARDARPHPVQPDAVATITLER